MAKKVKRIFVSYSRDDRAWTYELAKTIQDELDYSIFVDYTSINIGTNWWETICENIRDCDYVIYIMTEKSTESIYCNAEIDYALALNKPILPVMLKSCKFPEKLSEKQIHYLLITENMNFDKVLIRLQRGISDINELIGIGSFKLPEILPNPPKEPQVKVDSFNEESVFEAFLIGAKLAENGELEQALTKFSQIIDAHKNSVVGKRAQKRLEEIISYQNILQLAKRPGTKRDAQAMWEDYTNHFGTDFDPLGLSDILKPVASSTYIIKPVQKTSNSYLPNPFEWIDIPSGIVNLSYGGKDKSFKLGGFAISKYLITNDQFRMFVNSGGYDENRWWTRTGWSEKEQRRWISPSYWLDRKWNIGIKPVVGVSWYETIAFSLWLSEITGEKIMIPTEQQWQRAAQGDTNDDYPWGNFWDRNRCNNGEYGIGETTPVTQFEFKGESPYGVLDMAGNVWEWCLTNWESGQQTIEGNHGRVLRGGSFSGYAPNLTTQNRRRSDPDYRNTGVGFRIIKMK